MTDTSAVRYEKDADGIVTLTMDDPSASANTMNQAYKEAMAAAIDRLEAEKDEITGVVVTSAKKVFFALATTTPVTSSSASSRSRAAAIDSL